MKNCMKNLSLLFDYQRFEGNQALQYVIDSVHACHPVQSLTMDDMVSIAAAGRPYNDIRKNKPE
jgi:hypothetical protein